MPDTDLGASKAVDDSFDLSHLESRHAVNADELARLQAIARDGHYDLSVQMTTVARVKIIEDRWVLRPLRGTIVLEIDDFELEIGSILAYSGLCQKLDPIIYTADREGGDTMQAFEWLKTLKKRRKSRLIAPPYLLLESVRLEPEWRGFDFSLPAVATFLDLTMHSFVFFMPAPLNWDGVQDEQHDRDVKALCCHWQKLGMSHYDAESNYLWEPEWTCPKDFEPTERRGY